MIQVVSERIRAREEREKQQKIELKKLKQRSILDLSEFDKRNTKTLISSQPEFIKTKFSKFAQVKFNPRLTN